MNRSYITASKRLAFMKFGSLFFNKAFKVLKKLQKLDYVDYKRYLPSELWKDAVVNYGDINKMY